MNKEGKILKNHTLGSHKRIELGDKAVSCLLLLPFMGLFFVFNILPVFSSVVLSFFDYDMVSMPNFCGFNNYLRMFIKDSLFWKTFGNTLRFSIIAGPLGFLLSFVLAWMINEFSKGARVAFTFGFYTPALVGNALLIWQVIFSGDSYAYLNNFLISFGLITEPIQWFQNTEFNMKIILIIQLWMSMGTSFLANIAGLQNVNKDLYEAGAIDGIRTRWHELWYITLPSMKSIILFSAVMQIQAVFSVSSLVTSLVGYPSVDNSVDMLVSYIGDVGTTRYEMGYAATLSVFLVTLVLVFRFVIGGLLNLVGKSDE